MINNYIYVQVQYDATGFLEQNRDTLQSDIIQLLSASRKSLLNLFASVSHVQSVGVKFKVIIILLWEIWKYDWIWVLIKFLDNELQEQLFKLIQQLENSKAHFIRCIRPNTKQLPGMYEKEFVLQQLRCSRVMEIVQILKSRYSIRLTHQEFANRYKLKLISPLCPSYCASFKKKCIIRFGCLLSENIICMDPLSTSLAILQQYRVPPHKYQVGYTKLFFQEQVSFEN